LLFDLAALFFGENNAFDEYKGREETAHKWPGAR
jgi:hypothetical protein